MESARQRFVLSVSSFDAVTFIYNSYAAVPDDWLSEDLRRLSQSTDPEIRIQLVVAKGKRACAQTVHKQNMKGYLLPSFNPCNGEIDVRLNDIVTMFIAVDIKHFLPEHPSTVGDDVVVITGPLRGQLRKVFKIESGLFSIGTKGNNNRNDDTHHPGHELALVKIMPSKKKGKRK